jgi:hypothetical protein
MNGSYQAFNFGALHGVSGGYGESNTDAFLDASRNLSSFVDAVAPRSDAAVGLGGEKPSLDHRADRRHRVRPCARRPMSWPTTNHCHAMTIQYFEVLRHLQVVHELADVQECLFVPLPMKQFDLLKTLRWRQSLSTYLQRRDLAPAFDAARRVQTNWTEVMTPVGRYADETRHRRRRRDDPHHHHSAAAVPRKAQSRSLARRKRSLPTRSTRR